MALFRSTAPWADWLHINCLHKKYLFSLKSWFLKYISLIYLNPLLFVRLHVLTTIALVLKCIIFFPNEFLNILYQSFRRQILQYWVTENITAYIVLYSTIADILYVSNNNSYIVYFCWIIIAATFYYIFCTIINHYYLKIAFFHFKCSHYILLLHSFLLQFMPLLLLIMVFTIIFVDSYLWRQSIIIIIIIIIIKIVINHYY